MNKSDGSGYGLEAEAKVPMKTIQMESSRRLLAVVNINTLGVQIQCNATLGEDMSLTLCN
jgi:hypothetical protein